MPPRLAPIARSSSRSSKKSDPPAAGDTVAVGDVVAAHALSGLVRVRAYQAPAPSLVAGREVLLERDGVRRPATIRSAAPHARGLLLVGLTGVDGRDAAEALVGSRVLVHARDLPPADDAEFYWHELEGFRVDTVVGEPVGSIVETFSTGINDVWVVRDDRREVLVPVIADVVRTIDRVARRVVIVPMPGLLD